MKTKHVKLIQDTHAELEALLTNRVVTSHAQAGAMQKLDNEIGTLRGKLNMVLNMAIGEDTPD